jgi:hypothetical protein
MPRLARSRPADILDATVDYLAQTPDGPVGIVDGWKRNEQGRASAIIIAQGWFGRRRFEIPIDKLIEIDHKKRRVVLAPAAAPPEPTGLLHRLVAPERGRTANETTTTRPERGRMANEATAQGPQGLDESRRTWAGAFA